MAALHNVMNQQFEFQFPWLLGLLALLPLYALLLGRPGRISALRFSSGELIRTVGATARSAAGSFLLFLRLLCVGLVIVSLAGPRFANDRVESQTRSVDILLVVDLSLSMLALDMSPPGELHTRLDIAKSVIEDFVHRRQSDRIGLLAFSGAPYLASPLTLNHDWLAGSLQRLRINLIPEAGTAIGDATAAASRRLLSLRDSKSRIVILLTDGDNNRGELDPIPAAQVAAALGVKVYTIGIGKPEPCMLPQFNWQTGDLLLDAGGKPIFAATIPAANYEVLQTMARMTGGRFYTSENRRQLERIYNEIDQLEKAEVILHRHVAYTPLFQWPLLAALAVLALELLLGNTRYRRIP
jgi:Ca-activated chloride channel family protein